ncbi:MAG: hypothetical protein NZ958_03680 [Bacteroidia bacterium]|nr:hypothetical protein [Bacteroidia bacterium]MDW8088319.1 hypothetical protein [Bacteroidia bacterium]
MQAPALNFPISVISNSGDLDVESIELLPGPASALYGPNAFSGILNVHTKDPFRFPGFSSSVRLGVNHLDGRDTTPQPLYEVALRYAKAWNNRLGFKVYANWFSAHDWIAQNGTDMGVYAGALGLYAVSGPNNPGYDAVNRHGDEARIDPATVQAIANQLGLILGGGLPDNPNDLSFYLARTGYWEREIIQYDTRVGKLYGGLYYRLRDRLQLSYNAFLSTGATVYQGPNRFSLQDFLFAVNKLEASSPNFRIWGYALLENSGKSFDSRLAALNLLSSVKPHINWLAQYVLTYTGQMRRIAEAAGVDPEALGIPRGGDHAAARAFADSDRPQALEEPLRLIGSPFAYLMGGGSRPQPGTEDFRRRLREVTDRANFAQGGAAFYDRSALYHLEGQYDFTPYLQWIQVLIGGNYRYFLMNSKGTIFADTAAPIRVDEYGIFLQATKPLWVDRLRLQGSLRYDKNRNFRGNLTSRLAFLMAIDPKKRHIVRAAYQVGFRMPTLQAQYIDLEVGRFRYIGALEQFTQAYGIRDNNYSAESVQAFRDSLTNRTRGSNNPSDYADLLRTLPMGEIKLEKVAAFEVGTRHLIGDRLFIDIDYAYSRFTNFMSMVDFYGPRRFRQPDGSWYVGRLTPDSVAVSAYTSYRRFFNTSTPVYTHHLALTLQYSLTRQFFLNSNFTYAEIILSEEAKLDKLLASFNTPRYKANLYLTARELLPNKRLGFAIGYRWINAYLFEESFYSQIIPT